MTTEIKIQKIIKKIEKKEENYLSLLEDIYLLIDNLDIETKKTKKILEKILNFMKEQGEKMMCKMIINKCNFYLKKWDHVINYINEYESNSFDIEKITEHLDKNDLKYRLKYTEVMYPYEKNEKMNQFVKNEINKANIFYLSKKQKKMIVELTGGDNDESVEKDKIKAEIISEFLSKFFPGQKIKRGDLISIYSEGERYRNDDIFIYDGEKVESLSFDLDEYGHIPKTFTIDEFKNPKYWSDHIAHNKIVWISTDTINLQTNKKIKIDDQCEIIESDFINFFVINLKEEKTSQKIIDGRWGFFDDSILDLIDEKILLNFEKLKKNYNKNILYLIIQ